MSGLAIAIMIGALAVIFGADHPVATGALGGALSGGVVWLISLSFWRSRVYRTPQPKLPSVLGSSEVLRLQVMTHDLESAYGRGVWASLPIDRETLIEIAIKLAGGASFSHASLVGKYRPLSRAQYEAVRDEFLARGLVYWNSPHSRNQGLSMSRAGVAAMKRLAEMYGPSLPQNNVRPKLIPELPYVAPAHTRTRQLSQQVDGVDVTEDDILNDVWQ